MLVLAAEDVTGLSPAQGVHQRQVRRRDRRLADGRRPHQRRLRLRHAGPQGAAPARRAVALQGRGLGDRRRHHPAGAGPGPAAPPPRRRWTSSCPSATTSTRAASCCSAASTRCSRRAPTARTTTTRSRRRSAPTPTGAYPCLPLLNDFLQYWLGAFNYVDDGGTDPDGDAVPAHRRRRQRSPASPATLNAAGSADNQDHTASFLPLSSFLPPAQFPQFGRATSPVDWVRPGASAVRPVRPVTGTLFSGRGDENYKRLTRTVDLTGEHSGELRFWTSYDIEPDWDFLFVEAHEVGTDNWTTLPDANGQTTHGDRATAAPRAGGELHPFLAHYQGAGLLQPTGTTGTWNAATGSVRRLEGVGRRPVGVRRQAGRAVDHLRVRLGHPGSRRLPRRRPR